MIRLTGRKTIRPAILAAALLCSPAFAATADRITHPVDPRQTAKINVPIHRLAQPRFDRGAVVPEFVISHVLLMVKPSAAQQVELNGLLADQQNPSSRQFHRWLSPEEFGDRFGLNPGDHAKMQAWLRAEGFTVNESGRARNWIDFSGTAGQINRALRTSIHRYEINGETHFANSTEVSVPAAVAEVTGGFVGLDDIQAKPAVQLATPEFNSGTSHYLTPGDFSTIYNLGPLAAAGIDGTGVNIGIVGQTQLLLTDLQDFRTKYNLPAKDPKQVRAGNDPGLALAGSTLIEANLDIEWSGAVAPGANIYYYYSTNFLTATIAAINANLVQLISISWGGAEIDNSALTYQPIMQQANAQGITIFASSGDSGAANYPDGASFSRFGPAVSFPASFPEVTAVGGTQFNDTTGGPWWAASNDGTSFASALGYIPENAWSGGGGGASVVFLKPVWQTGPGVPADNARDLPDISLSASTHDGYEVMYLGSLTPVGGTSASAPSFAGITALLNHYLIANGTLAQPGLGNINPQLYRMAQSSPAAFHDITGGSNGVTCAPGSPACISPTFGYAAGPGYDLATGIGTVDANSFVTQWNSSTSAVNVNLSVSAAKGTLNDTFQLTATVTSAGGSGTPTGIVDFSSGNAQVRLGSVTLDPSSGQPTATLNIPGYALTGTGTIELTAQYRGDSGFSGGGATAKVQITSPTGVSSVVPLVPASVTATPDSTGLFWEFKMTLAERGGVASVLTGVNVDGQDQPISQYFPLVSIAPNSSLVSRSIIYRNLAYPLVRTFVFSGVDATGQTWTRQASITFISSNSITQAVILSALPLVMPQNLAADPGCQWSQQLVLTETTGYPQVVTGLYLGNISMSDQIVRIFGTNQLAPYRSIEGNICWSGVTPGATNTVGVFFSAGFSQDIAVSFAGPTPNPVAVTAAPVSVSLATADPGAPAHATLSISAPDGQPWTIGISPQNRASGWLTLSQTSGTGSAQVTLQASGNGFEAGAYLAKLVIQGPNMFPAAVSVPVMFVYGDSSGTTITSVTNAASGASVAAPGMQAVLKGTGLWGSGTLGFAGSAYGFAASQFLITVNGIPAVFNSASATQVKFQIPYEVSAGPAVVGVSYNGKAAGYLFQVAGSAPAIFADDGGNVTPNASVQAGKSLTLTMTGDGITSPFLADGATPSTLTSMLYKPALPFTLTIGGVPAFLTSYGIAAGSYGVTTLNVAIPPNAPTGIQPVVVTVNGVDSPAVNVTINPAP